MVAIASMRTIGRLLGGASKAAMAAFAKSEGFSEGCPMHGLQHMMRVIAHASLFIEID